VKVKEIEDEVGSDDLLGIAFIEQSKVGRDEHGNLRLPCPRLSAACVTTGPPLTLQATLQLWQFKLMRCSLSGGALALAGRRSRCACYR